MQNRNSVVFIGLLVALASVVLSITFLKQNYESTLFIFIIGTVLIFFTAFENKNIKTEKIVLIALLSAISIAGRVLFAAIPSVQPSSFIIIITGIVFGRQMGFMTGAVTALASNMILGQGPWTPWQMFCWGMMGFLSGVLSEQLKKYPVFRILYGFSWGFVFGWIMNLWFISGGYLGSFSIEAIVLAGAASFFMDLSHGLANAFLLAIGAKKFISIFNRIADKYGLRRLKPNET